MEYEKTRGTRGRKQYADSKQVGFTGDGRNMRGPKKTPPGWYEYGAITPIGQQKQRILKDHRTLKQLDYFQPGENGSGLYVFPMEPTKKNTGRLALVG
jgi:hypothetical protein